MTDEVLKWLLGVLTSSSLIAGVAFIARDSVAKFFSKTIEHRFDKKIEAFKSGIRDNEKELDQIRAFLVGAKKERDTALQNKRIEAAESLLRARDSLAQLSMLVEYIKILNTEQILKDGDDPKIIEFVEALTKPFDLEEKIKNLGNIDKTAPRLYLSERSLKSFDVYQGIMLHAAFMMRIFTIPLRDKTKLLKSGNLSKSVIELAPFSKDGFDKYGESYAYYWSTYFHDEILKALRHEISGVDDMARDTESIQKLALDSRRAQVSIRASLEQAGLPKNLIKEDEPASAASTAAEQART